MIPLILAVKSEFLLLIGYVFFEHGFTVISVLSLRIYRERFSLIDYKVKLIIPGEFFNLFLYICTIIVPILFSIIIYQDSKVVGFLNWLFLLLDICLLLMLPLRTIKKFDASLRLPVIHFKNAILCILLNPILFLVLAVIFFIIHSLI